MDMKFDFSSVLHGFLLPHTITSRPTFVGMLLLFGFASFRTELKQVMYTDLFATQFSMQTKITMLPVLLKKRKRMG